MAGTMAQLDSKGPLQERPIPPRPVSERVSENRLVPRRLGVQDQRRPSILVAPETLLPYPDRTPPGPPCKDCPNIVFALTDDQDLTLGGWTTPMRQTQSLIEAKGTMLTRWTIHTPICSPSRSETVSGRYFHNIKSDVAVPPPNLLPMGLDHVDGSRYAGESFGVYLRRDAGYQVGLFGKANFNTFDGFDRWFQGFYDGYGREEDQWWDDDECPSSGEEQCQRPGKYLARDDEYATSLIGNKTIEWLRRPSVGNGERPFFAYFAPACPHTPATPADWYEETPSALHRSNHLPAPTAHGRLAQVFGGVPRRGRAA